MDVNASKPTILFVCVHNAGRSQMAAAFAEQLSGGAVTVLSAGSEPAEVVNPVAVGVMRELGIDLARAAPRRLTDEDARIADVVITMGCGDACPIYPGKRYEDWELRDPAGQPIELVREIRDEIKERVTKLLAGLEGEPRR
jgi:arsenate reductase